MSKLLIWLGAPHSLLSPNPMPPMPPQQPGYLVEFCGVAAHTTRPRHCQSPACTALPFKEPPRLSSV